MGAGFVLVDQDTPLLLPPDLRQCVPEDHLVHFVIDAVGQLDVRGAKVNERGTGNAQHPPGMILEPLIYNYATGMFSIRKIERATYENVAVRVAAKASRERYKLRQQTVEPVFGIIKEALGFRRLSLRGLAKANTEWTLVTMAYNLKRLFHLKVCLPTA